MVLRVQYWIHPRPPHTHTGTGQLVHLSHNHGLLLFDPTTNHTSTVITLDELVSVSILN